MPEPARRTVLSCAAALGLLTASAPRPTAAVAQLAATPTTTDPTAPVVAAVALLAWALTLWLVVTTALVLAARAPGRAGRVAAALGRRAAPAAVRRTLELALGVTVTVTGVAVPASASSTVPAAASAPAASVSTAAPTLPSLDWPGLTRDTPTPAPPPLPAPPAAGPAVAAVAAVVVAPGDSLWTLAHDHLERTGTTPPTDRQVAAAWPRWWSANRAAIGEDPDLIRPGTVLQPPRP